MGAIGGSVFHSIKGFRNAPSVSNAFIIPLKSFVGNFATVVSVLCR